ELIAAVEKMKQKQASASFRSSDLELLLANLQAKGKSAKIAVPTFDGLQMVHTDEIVRCTAMESCTEISLTNGSRLVVSRILKEYEELLSDLNFFRIHNSYLINLNHVVKYVKGDGGYVLMSDGNHVEVSRRKKGELLNRLSRLRL
ncbi:MAG: LytTR family transcriptional regulator, partial [Flavobacteriales bacterium]|nr:LytTR family transcriptional regulator [Flavobacteriales bacterium]